MIEWCVVATFRRTRGRHIGCGEARVAGGRGKRRGQDEGQTLRERGVGEASDTKKIFV